MPSDDLKPLAMIALKHTNPNLEIQTSFTEPFLNICGTCQLLKKKWNCASFPTSEKNKSFQWIWLVFFLTKCHCNDWCQSLWPIINIISSWFFSKTVYYSPFKHFFSKRFFCSWTWVSSCRTGNFICSLLLDYCCTEGLRVTSFHKGVTYAKLG